MLAGVHNGATRKGHRETKMFSRSKAFGLIGVGAAMALVVSA